INSSANKNAKEGSRYSYSVNANDPNGHDLNYNLVNGPKWLSLSDKTLSGTPGYDQSGTYGIKIKVDDGYGGVDTQSFTLTVSNVNRPPSIDSSPPTSAIEGEEYSYVIEASDPGGDDISYTLHKGPDWLSLDGNHLHGTPGMDAQG